MYCCCCCSARTQTFNGGIVLVDKVRLDKLDSQGWFANTTAAYNHNFVPETTRKTQMNGPNIRQPCLLSKKWCFWHLIAATRKKRKGRKKRRESKKEINTYNEKKETLKSKCSVTRCMRWVSLNRCSFYRRLNYCIALERPVYFVKSGTCRVSLQCRLSLASALQCARLLA